MPKRKHVLLPILLIILVAAIAVLGLRVYNASTYSVLPANDATAGFENTLIATPGDADTTLTALELAKAINTVRTENMLQAFTINQNLMEAASNLAVSYLSTGQTTVADADWATISASGYQYATANVLSSSAKTITTANAQGFFNGQSTKSTLTSDTFQDLGVAVVEGMYNGEQTNVIILMFATAASNYTPVPYDESTGKGSIPSTGTGTDTTPVTCNESLKASYKATYDNDKNTANDSRNAKIASIDSSYPAGTESQLEQSEKAAANSQYDRAVTAATSSYTSNLKSLNCSI